MVWANGGLITALMAKPMRPGSRGIGRVPAHSPHSLPGALALQRPQGYPEADGDAMATLAQRTEAVEERVDSLETVLARFMAHTEESFARTNEYAARTEESIARLERIVEHHAQEGARDREEAAREREHDREEAARKWEREREEAARYREEAARERREMNKRWGELANKMGTVVEDIVAPSVRRLAREVFGCGDLVRFTTRQTVTRSDDRSRSREFDALYVGSRAVLLNSTKSSPRPQDARAFVEFLRSGEFRLYFPEYETLPIVPAFSSLSIPEDLVTYLTRHGIYALAMGDEAMQVLNLEAVRSRTAAP